MKYLLLIFLVLCLGCSRAQMAPTTEGVLFVQSIQVEEDFWYVYPIEVIGVTDGDTFDVNLDLGFNIQLRNERIRLLGGDAFDRPRIKKEQATFFTEKFLAKAPLYLWSKGERGNFGRILGTVKNVEGEFLHIELRENGLTTGRYESYLDLE